MSDPTISAEMADFAQRFISESRRGLFIDGFAPDGEPAPSDMPPLSTLRAVDPSFNALEDETVPEAPASPLMELGLKALPKPAPVPDFTAADLIQEPGPRSGLYVNGNQACFNGSGIELSEKERISIAQIVALALVRRAKSEYMQLLKETPKRPYVRRKKGVVDAQAVERNAPRGSDRVRRRRARRDVPSEGAGQAAAPEGAGSDRQGDQGA